MKTGWVTKKLGEVCMESKERIPSSSVSLTSYVTTDNMVKIDAAFEKIGKLKANAERNRTNAKELFQLRLPSKTKSSSGLIFSLRKSSCLTITTRGRSPIARRCASRSCARHSKEGFKEEGLGTMGTMATTETVGAMATLGTTGTMATMETRATMETTATSGTGATGGGRLGAKATSAALAKDAGDGGGCRQGLQSRQSPRQMPSSTKIILPHGGYKKLLTYQKSDIICQGTVIFCRRFLPKYGDRTVDQMVQAARSCKQNIVEGSEASATSKETELKLTNVAKASLEELLEDYLDYLKNHGLPVWAKDSEKGVAARELGRKNEIEVWKPYFEGRGDEVVANLLVSLIRQCTYLLAKQLKQLEEDFKHHGGIRERMHAARVETRGSGWEIALADWLGLAKDAEGFAVRGREAKEAFRRIAWRIKRQRGW